MCNVIFYKIKKCLKITDKMQKSGNFDVKFGSSCLPSKALSWLGIYSGIWKRTHGKYKTKTNKTRLTPSKVSESWWVLNWAMIFSENLIWWEEMHCLIHKFLKKRVNCHAKCRLIKHLFGIVDHISPRACRINVTLFLKFIFAVKFLYSVHTRQCIVFQMHHWWNNSLIT